MAKQVFFIVATELAKDDSGMTIRDSLLFHCFNPHGIYAAKKFSDAKISARVSTGRMESGAILAYGSMHYDHTNRLLSLLETDRVSRIDLACAIDGVQLDIDLATRAMQKASK